MRQQRLMAANLTAHGCAYGLRRVSDEKYDAKTVGSATFLCQLPVAVACFARLVFCFRHFLRECRELLEVTDLNLP